MMHNECIIAFANDVHAAFIKMSLYSCFNDSFLIYGLTNMMMIQKIKGMGFVMGLMNLNPGGHSFKNE